MPIQAIAYTSNASPAFRDCNWESFARNAAFFNKQAGVTGVLLFDGIRFLQYFEGPDDGLSVVYQRILNSRLHTNVAELGRGRAGQRNFPYWSMRLVEAEPQAIDGAIGRDWSCFLTGGTGESGNVRGGVEALALIILPPQVSIEQSLA